MTEKIYPISYSVQSNKFNKEYLQEHDLGGCDAIILHSIIYPPDGSRNEQMIAIDSEGKQLNPEEVFKSFCGMAHSLSEDTRLRTDKREFCRGIIDAVRKALGVK